MFHATRAIYASVKRSFSNNFVITRREFHGKNFLLNFFELDKLKPMIDAVAVNRESSPRTRDTLKNELISPSFFSAAIAFRDCSISHAIRQTSLEFAAKKRYIQHGEIRTLRRIRRCILGCAPLTDYVSISLISLAMFNVQFGNKSGFG
jgi:hypothetical protein